MTSEQRAVALFRSGILSAAGLAAVGTVEIWHLAFCHDMMTPCADLQAATWLESLAQEIRHLSLSTVQAVSDHRPGFEYGLQVCP